MSRYGYGRRVSSSAPSPRWLELKHAGSCGTCGCELPVGSVAWWHKGHPLVCTSLVCAGAAGLTREVGRPAPVRDPGEDMADRWADSQGGAW